MRKTMKSWNEYIDSVGTSLTESFTPDMKSAFTSKQLKQIGDIMAKHDYSVERLNFTTVNRFVWNSNRGDFKSLPNGVRGLAACEIKWIGKAEELGTDVAVIFFDKKTDVSFYGAGKEKEALKLGIPGYQMSIHFEITKMFITDAGRNTRGQIPVMMLRNARRDNSYVNDPLTKVNKKIANRLSIANACKENKAYQTVLAAAKKAGYVVKRFYIEKTAEDEFGIKDFSSVEIDIDKPQNAKFQNGYCHIWCDVHGFSSFREKDVMQTKLGDCITTAFSTFNSDKGRIAEVQRYAKEVADTAEFIKVLSEIKIGDMPIVQK